MNGGYVMVTVPKELTDSEFVSGTKIPGFYKKLNTAFSTGKLVVASSEVPNFLDYSVSPLVCTILKVPGEEIVVSHNGTEYTVQPDDTVITN